MPEIIDLGMDDEEYLQIIAQGRDPINEYFYKRELVRSGFSPADAHRLVLLLNERELSTDGEAIVKEFWQLVMS